MERITTSSEEDESPPPEPEKEPGDKIETDGANSWEILQVLLMERERGNGRERERERQDLTHEERMGRGEDLEYGEEGMSLERWGKRRSLGEWEIGERRTCENP